MTANNFTVTTTLGRNWIRRRHSQIVENATSHFLMAASYADAGEPEHCKAHMQKGLDRLQSDLDRLEQELMEPR